MLPSVYVMLTRDRQAGTGRQAGRHGHVVAGQVVGVAWGAWRGVGAIMEEQGAGGWLRRPPVGAGVLAARWAPRERVTLTPPNPYLP